MIWSNPSLFTDENPKSLKIMGLYKVPSSQSGWNWAAALISNAGFIHRAEAQFGMLPKTRDDGRGFNLPKVSISIPQITSKLNKQGPPLTTKLPKDPIQESWSHSHAQSPALISNSNESRVQTIKGRHTFGKHQGSILCSFLEETIFEVQA